MTHLYIEQNGITEEVSSSVISKLYEVASSGSLDLTSNLKGRLHTNIAQDIHVSYLNDNFNELYINADELYITFIDSEVERVLTELWNPGGEGLTSSLISSKNKLPSLLFSGNTVITSFNELGRFENIVKIEGEAFYNTTNLTQIDLSNITHLGFLTFRNSGVSGVLNLNSLIKFEGKYTFAGCSNITEVNFNPNVFETFASYIFSDCTNLLRVYGIRNVLLVDGLFKNCSKLTVANIDYNFDNTTIFTEDLFNGCSLITGINLSNAISIKSSAFKNSGMSGIINLPNIISFPGTQEQTSLNTSGGLFRGVTGITQVSFGNNFNKQLYTSVFYGCTNLQSVTGLSGMSILRSEVFYNCSNLLTIDFSIEDLTYIGDNAFYGCSSLPMLNVTNLDATYIGRNAFNRCQLSGIINLVECLELGESTFSNCNNITEIHAPKLTTINKFTNWSNLSNLEVLDLPVTTRLSYVQNNPKLTTINAPLATTFGTYGDTTCSFSNCPLLSTLNINFSSVTILGNSCFNSDAGLNGLYLEFPNVTKLETEALKNNSINFVFSNNSVITLSGYGWFTSYTGTIYVPDNLVNTYKTTANWSTIADKIKGISELPTT